MTVQELVCHNESPTEGGRQAASELWRLKKYFSAKLDYITLVVSSIPK